MGAQSFPQFSVPITQDEATSDLLMGGLATAEIFGVRCALVRLGLGYHHHQFPLLIFPELHPGDGHEVHYPDNTVLLLQEECPSHRQQQRWPGSYNIGRWGLTV